MGEFAQQTRELCRMHHVSMKVSSALSMSFAHAAMRDNASLQERCTYVLLHTCVYCTRAQPSRSTRRSLDATHNRTVVEGVLLFVSPLRAATVATSKERRRST